MRATWWIGIWATFLSSTVRSIETTPFSAPETAGANRRAFDVLQLLKRADNNCPSGYSPCTSLGNSDACCKKGTHCSRDAADNIACCPTGASCTGSLTASTTAGGTKTGSSFMFPQDATATTTAAVPTGSHVGSTMEGAYPFIYVPTTFANEATCSSYYSQCQSQYTQCTGALMGRYGVTVGGGAGVTVEAVTAPSQATSICSELSAEACHGLGLGYCGTVETGAAHDTQGNNAASGRTSSLHDLMLGLAVGVAGMFV